MNFRPCDGCSACCEGYLKHEVNGFKIENGISCKYLKNKRCSIYEERPSTCKKYQCAWSQHLFPEWMRPDKSGLLVSVEIDSNNKQFLKVVELKKVVEYNYYAEIEKFSRDNDTYAVVLPYKNVIPIKPYESFK